MSTRKKSRPHSNQPQQLPQPSDYETDAPAMEPHSRPPPRSNEELNLSVIKRHYPETTLILSIAPYVSIYTFSKESESWVKENTDGPLFVCALEPSPDGVARFAIVILNRRGLENFRFELTDEEDLEIAAPFLILPISGVAYGLWIYEPENTQMVNITGQIIIECAKQARLSRNAIEEQSLGQHTNGNEPTQEAVEPQADGEDEEDGSIPMGRQLSLRELFGKQREQDSGWTVNTHSPATKQEEFPPPQVQRQPQQPLRSTPFDMNPETEFFRSGRSFTPQMVVQQHAQLRQKHGQ